ncbi:creatinine amidohydrolase [Angulomicrobium tetraedrale]|uniref:Creatinine amidohydrolase n=1 Tax=Ancylobacter tetraedralis TaxID=217068 RepID=A0A839ZDR9_9HYPH|nr:creatininase [Ancylobacter tetraedralis]MBB3772858.1 creatinine amidohydrolase [Ancylobacter tetraedralis]
MVDSVRLDELSWPEFAQKVAAGAPVLLPLGSTEQHGPHLPLNVDVVLPTGVCERVAREIGGIVAPTLNYGCKSMPRSGGGEVFPGTLSLDAHTFALVLRDVIRNLGRQGVRRLVIVNGHYENCWPSVEGLDLALRELRRDGITDMQVMRLEYWDFATRATLDQLFPDGFPGIDLEHASLLETSLMLVLRPDLVEMDKVPNDGPATFPTYDKFPVPDDFGLPPSGVLAVAVGSTAQKGELLMGDYITRISAAITKEFGL